MRIRRKSTGQQLVLSESDLLGAGGEARIYRLPDDPGLVAKIWHKPTPERAAKVRAMLENPPQDPTASQNHASIAWPIDLIETGTGGARTIGFAMPFVSGMSPIIDFFNPKTRRQKLPLFNWFYLHRTARNLAIAVRALHERNYVIGDLNESNILVAPTALVTVVDTDSFQVWDGNRGQIFRCRVAKPEFTPPEMQGKDFSKTDRSPQQDAFPLAVLMFELLMEGTHPFAGTFRGQGEAPPYEQRISAGHFPYGGDINVPYTPKMIAPPFGILHPSLRQFFLRCFQDGHFDPKLRPDPQAWQWALEEAESALVSCWVNDQHIYGSHLERCPWCERTKVLGGRDPFPSIESVKEGTHMGPAVAPPRSSPGKPAPLNAGKGPMPPIPKPVPSASSPGTRKKGINPFAPLMPRNDWAWMSLTMAGLAIMLAPFYRTWLHIPFLLGVLGFICGVIGEVKSYGWYLDGKGRVVARAGLLLSLAVTGWFYVMVLSKVLR